MKPILDLSIVLEGVNHLIDHLLKVRAGLENRLASPQHPPVETHDKPFSDQQRQILQGIWDGLSNKEIAGRLQISESYVKAILQSMFAKTGVRTRSQLVVVALREIRVQPQSQPQTLDGDTLSVRTAIAAMQLPAEVDTTSVIPEPKIPYKSFKKRGRPRGSKNRRPDIKTRWDNATPEQREQWVQAMQAGRLLPARIPLGPRKVPLPEMPLPEMPLPAWAERRRAALNWKNDPEWMALVQNAGVKK